jgi:GNAT superfamily N-acetyltransferase
VAIIHEASPFTTVTVEGWLQQYRTTPERAQAKDWAAIVDGEIAGFAFAALKWFSSANSAFVALTVGERHRNRGVGSALWDEVDARLRELGPDRVTAMFVETPEAVAFARARGFELDRAETLSSVDPRTVAPNTEDVGIVQLRALDPHEVYEVDLETTKDVPTSDSVDDYPYEQWLDGMWRRPALQHDGSFGALVDGRLASFTLLAVNRDLHRGFTEYTATLREFRGQGLAERVKRASLSWAAREGITTVWTTNDETNAPMLAVNARLGYEPSLRRVEYLRTGTTTSAEPGSPTISTSAP